MKELFWDEGNTIDIYVCERSIARGKVFLSDFLAYFEK